MKEIVLEKLRRPRLWGAVAAALVLVAVLAAAVYHFGADTGRIRPGTAVEGVDIGGLTPEEARSRLEAELLPRYRDMQVLLCDGDALVAAFTWEEVGAAPDLAAAVEEAAALGYIPGKGWLGRLRRVWSRLFDWGEMAVSVPVTFNQETLAARLPASPQDAWYDKETGQVVEGHVGVQVDAEALAAALEAVEAGKDLRFQVTVEQPGLTAGRLREVLFRDTLGTCTTTVGGSSVRQNNVRLSAAAINGTVLNPGEVFDYNAVVGERTVEKGYGAAPAYINGETVSDIGGGICQTSSTLYLAALRSNLEITERYAHRYVSGYIPMGMDATVSWGGPEFRFRNDTGYPLRIDAAMEGNQLTITLCGTKLDEGRVEMTYEVLSTVPYTTEYRETTALAPGETQVQRSGYTGYTVQTYRNLYDAGGNLVLSAPEARSVYQSRSEIVLVGRAQEAPEPPAEEKPESQQPAEETETEEGGGAGAMAPDPEFTDDPLPLRDMEAMRG